ncbi:A disintegrin and metalloproteinase with thrombospondin motifs 16-like [Frieseomelitta varia]|uniref:A disintegrin and metalloproteinase with thrombospondin motifs 16-like n=1 Tax=Frieseomelitta varia TaxID=561572 RepID=UPI001CB6A994|nr:A disintegrin and metalloproteinase with thrombospondin motifs 16-like [Frieseomelitta varia]
MDRVQTARGSASFGKSVRTLLPERDERGGLVDGTTCYRNIRDICIGGVCREILCDLNMESNVVEDACDVCKGNGNSCSLKNNRDNDRRVVP